MGYTRRIFIVVVNKQGAKSTSPRAPARQPGGALSFLGLTLLCLPPVRGADTCLSGRGSRSSSKATRGVGAFFGAAAMPPRLAARRHSTSSPLRRALRPAAYSSPRLAATPQSPLLAAAEKVRRCLAPFTQRKTKRSLCRSAPPL